MSVTLANAGSVDRSQTDFYPTPPDVTVALLKRLQIPCTVTLWEPAAGEGHMVRAMESCGYTVIADDLYTYTLEDFRLSPALKAPWIITNPPFACSEQFIRAGLRLRAEGMAFLLKSQYWHSMRRAGLFERSMPRYVLPLTWRPDFLFGARQGAPTMEVLWTVWERGYEGPCEYELLRRPEVWV